MLDTVIQILFGSKSEADLKKLLPILRNVNTQESWARDLSREEILACTDQWRQEVSEGRSLDDLLPRAFAVAREAARRVLGERPYDVQLLGAIVLHQGKIMEMKTGEGKTLSSVAAAYLNSLTGRGVHVITVNDYLAERDASWMGPVFEYLGVSVGYIVSDMDNDARHVAYRKDITYGTNNEFGFDYLRDNMRYDQSGKVQRGHTYCIIDEIDSILIDEARTPLIISGQTNDDTSKFREVNQVVLDLQEAAKDPETGDYPEEPQGDYKVEEKTRKISFTDQGLNHLEELLARRKIISGSIFDQENFEYIHYATQALRAHRLFHKDQQYVVKDGKVEIVDEFTGRILHGRRYSEGLHQAIEAKERIRVAARNRTLATITFQNFFRMYDKISGMTGTAETEAKEFGNIYGLDVVVIPTNRPVARIDQDDVIYVSSQDKYNAICDELERLHKKGQPVLVGTISIEKSEELSQMLKKRGVRHEVLNAKNHAREALIVAEAGAKGSITIATNMAGRGTDIKLGGNPEFRARRSMPEDASPEDIQKAIAREREKWRQDYQEVRSLGGLFVLGTERHESRRIDNQLRGRSGRQGDPGESRFFLSMDDDLMRLFGGGRFNLKAIMERGLEPGEPLNHSMINKSIERAQNKVEERNFDIRKHLLEYDDVVNEQRKVVYSQRDAIMEDAALTERIMNTAEDVLEELLEEHPVSGPLQEAQAHHLLGLLQEQLLFFAPREPAEYAGMDQEAFRKTILTEMRQELSQKAGVVGAERLNYIIRIEYIRTIDQRWQEHLENLEELREAVYLRGYAQKNPLLEYKLEGFRIFDEFLADIRIKIARLMFAIRATGMEERRPAGATQGTAQHSSTSLLGSGPAAAGGRGPAPQEGSLPRQSQVRRTVPKVGRNDPCPCGSGKKYKHCHGK
ncbi:preprotein translocase subunit SecA [Alkalispirochaeta sphaeroplastigenens]|uniref:Protein translocase subunit SecA n=1 Tax=Alkalispirochaeta sphaeroplastigenens TaxID=1187066 RepID=A0A2S4JNN8_9SPIO|nr:preprotein translocase subunit SecA [Alkalispirochaeta sphaeroplastigenens]POR01147.1 preprotein translocase subunit SecA [Alkalispirochaeta sphaeroplastigenens]